MLHFVRPLWGKKLGLKASEGKADLLIYAVNDGDGRASPKLDCTMALDDSRHVDEGKLRDFVTPIPLTLSSPEIESFANDLVFHVDMEPELPELVVSYKENFYHDFKDIYIDEEFPSKDRFFFNIDGDENNLCSFLIPEDINSKIAQEKEYLDLHIPDVLRSSSKNENLATHQPIFDILMSLEETGSRNQFFVECETSESCNMDIVSDLTSKIECESYINNVEAKSITFDFKSSAATASGGGKRSQTAAFENLETCNSSRPEDMGTESFSSQLQHSHGDLISSASFPLSGLISYSGQIACSGNLSRRSDNSTTSTGSFAFPILQSEWNSSPVRMPKADWRSSGKCRSWRQYLSLLCCRF